MRQGDENVGVHDGPADLGLLHILAALNRDLHVVIAPEAVSDEDLASGGEGRKAVFIGGVQMLQGIFAPSRVKGVAVAQERDTAPFPDIVGHHPGVVGAEKGQISGLAKVHLDAHQLAFKVQRPQPRAVNEPAELVQLAGAHRHMEIRKINIGMAHSFLSL